jgi:hypothetical protein
MQNTAFLALSQMEKARNSDTERRQAGLESRLRLVINTIPEQVWSAIEGVTESLPERLGIFNSNLLLDLHARRVCRSESQQALQLLSVCSCR